MYKLQDGDIVKILPILKKDGSFIPILEVICYSIGNKMIYDNSNYLKRALQKKYFDENLTNNHPNAIKRYFLCIYHNNEIKYTSVGKKIMEKLMKDYKFDPRNNLQLSVKIEMINNTQIGPLPSFDKSEIIEKDWIKPNIDIDSQTDWFDYQYQTDWFDWLKNNQPFYIEDRIEKNNVFNNIEALKKEGLNDYIAEIISEDRDKKLEKILKKNIEN